MFGPSALSTARIPKISGTTPGMLDPTQLERLCRIPNSKLSFAAFNPLTASTQKEVPDLRKLSLNEELYRPKRVVVETLPTGECYWRFVPSARRDDNVSDEGQWPRVVELCGELVECSQDQWDIYKLDPLYECRVRSYPNLTVISKIGPKPQTNNRTPVGPKRRVSSESPTPEPVLPPPNPRKKHKIVVEPRAEESDEESEVEQMVIDDGPSGSRPRSAGPGNRAKKFKDEIERNRKTRREKAARRAEWLARQEGGLEFSVDQAFYSQSVPPEQVGKRKVNSLFNSLRSDHATLSDEEEPTRNSGSYRPSKLPKRRRTVSPASAKRDLEARRLEREKRRQRRREEDLNARRQERDARFLNELYAETPDLEMNGIQSQGTQEMLSANSDEEAIYAGVHEIDEDSARQAAIAESRRKLAELEADRPLWQEQAKKRMERDKAEEEASRAKAEARRRAVEAEEDRREKVRREQEAKETLRREREELARRERDRRQRQQRWSYGPWTVQRALERYRVLCESFDTTKFSVCEPLTVDVVPWPVLQSPVTFSVEDVNWAAVEKFFQEVRGLMRPQDYKTFVEKSHRRFHPDRWRSRSLLKSIIDETEKGCIDVAANTVAQALTPIWQELKGR